MYSQDAFLASVAISFFFAALAVVVSQVLTNRPKRRRSTTDSVMVPPIPDMWILGQDVPTGECSPTVTDMLRSAERMLLTPEALRQVEADRVRHPSTRSTAKKKARKAPAKKQLAKKTAKRRVS